MYEGNEYKIPTVNIKWDTEGGHLRINESDFNPKIHELWTPQVEVPVEEVAPVMPPALPPPVTKLSTKE